MGDLEIQHQTLARYEEEKIKIMLGYMETVLRCNLLQNPYLSDSIKVDSTVLNGLTEEQKAEVIRTMKAQVMIFDAIKQVRNNFLKVELAEEKLDKDSDAYKWIISEYVREKTINREEKSDVDKIKTEETEEVEEVVQVDPKEELETKLKNAKDDEERYAIIETLDNDKDIMFALNFLESDESKALVVGLELDDDGIGRYLGQISDEYLRAMMISSIKNDDKKIGLINKHLVDPKNKMIVIATIKDKQNRERVIKKFIKRDSLLKDKVEDKVEVDKAKAEKEQAEERAAKAEAKLAEVKAENERLNKEIEFLSREKVLLKKTVEQLSNLNEHLSEQNEEVKNDRLHKKVAQLTQEKAQEKEKNAQLEQRITQLEQKIAQLGNENYLLRAQSENEKKWKMSKLEDTRSEVEEIASWSDDRKKLLRLPFIDYDWDKAIIIASLKDDNKKIKLLKRLEFDASRAKVIASLADDRKKKELMSTLSYEENKEMVLNSVEDKTELSLVTLESAKAKFNFLQKAKANIAKLRAKLEKHTKEQLEEKDQTATRGGQEVEEH